MMAPPLVLASASPRRSALLRQLGLHHDVLPADVDETPLPGEAPAPHVERLARHKARVASARRPDALVLAGDTVVVADGRILGKPVDPDDAVAMLLALAGREHEVVSGLALALPGGSGGLLARVDRTAVTFRPFDEVEARAYVATGEPLDKAGAYGIQGRGGALVTRVAGDYTTVVGLPVSGLVELLHRAGWSYRSGHLHPRDPGHERE